MAEHAKLSASGAKKWMNCPGSVLLEATEPNRGSAYTAEGTTAHSLGELKIRLALKEITKVKYHKAIKELDVTKDMDEYTDGYRDFVIERLHKALERDKQAELLLEQRLDFSKWVPGGFGTGDAVIVSNDTLEIIDLKYGKGVKVEAENNPQLMLYGLGAVEEHTYIYEFENIQMTIYQPRIDNINICEIGVDELFSWGDAIKVAAEKANSGSDECIPGKHCDDGFCRARAKCRAYNEEKIKLAKSDFNLPATLSNEEIAEILELAPELKNWVTMVEAYALDKALQGEDFPGFKLVEGRSNRKYTDNESTIMAVLEDRGYDIDQIAPRKLLTISNMEKEIGKKEFASILGEFVIKPQGSPTLVTVDDKRPEWNSAVNDFKDKIEKENINNG